MSSRRLPMSVKDCLGWVKEKQKGLQGRDYSKNHLGIQEALQDHRDISTDIKEFSEVVDKHKKSKSREAKELEENYKLLQDLDLQKKRCLESMLYVTETENLFQNVQMEVENRSLYLSERKVVFDSVYRTPDLEQSARIHKDCVYAQRTSWQWLSQVSTCLHTHVQNAASYHQFFHDVQFLDRDMAQFVFWLNSGALSRITEDASPDALIRIVREMTNHLLDYQTRSERLKDESMKIYPINKRRETHSQPIKCQALVNYKNNGISLEENKTYLLTDNSDSEHWKVLNSSDMMAEVPAIVMVIPPPDGEAVNNSLRLREQVSAHFELAIKALRPPLRRFLTGFMDEREAKEFERLDDSQRNDVMKLVNLAMNLLADSESDADQQEFTDSLATVRKFLSQFKGDNFKYKDNSIYLQWKSAEKVVVAFQELMTYGQVYDEGKTAREEQYVTGDDGPPVYSSKAYFERAKPVELEFATQSDLVTRGDIQSEIYIYERNRESTAPKRERRKSDEIQQKLQKTLNAQLANGIDEASRETKTFVVKGVFDPRNGERISLQEALARKIINKAQGTFTNPDTLETMPISHAINLGLIDVTSGEGMMNGDAMHDGIDFLHGTSEVRTCPILGVIDPRSGKAISIDEAIAAGILDPETGLYFNPVTREQMALNEAMRKGYIILDARYADDVINGDAILSLDSKQRSYRIQGVIDPRTNQRLTLRRAIMSGIIDTERGIYRNPETGEEIPLAEAMRRGLVMADEVAPGTKGDTVLTFNELHLRSEKVLAAEPELTTERSDSVDAVVYNPNELVYNKLIENTQPHIAGIKDPLGQYDLSLEEAYKMGILRLDTAEYDRLDGDVIPLQEAAARGLIDPETLREILKSYSENSLGELVRRGVLDPETGLVTDPNTGLTCSLQSAIMQDAIKPETTFFYDVPSQRITSLATAIQDQVFSLEDAKYRKSPKESVSLAEADKSRTIRMEIDPDNITQHACALARLRPLMNTELKGVNSPFKRENVSVEEAIATDVLNLPSGKYIDEPGNERLPLISAVKNDKIESETALELFNALDKMSLREAIAENKLDPNTGMWLKEGERKPVTLDATDVDPNFVFFVDGKTGDVTSLGSAISKGKFEAGSGKFRDPKSGKVFSIAEAIENGLIKPGVDSSTCLNVTSTLKDLIDSGKVNPRTTTFVAPNGETMSLRDAMANGFLTMGSQIRLDPVTGNVSLSSDEGVVQSLVEIKEMSDWLDGVEQTLASEQKPNEKREVLKIQLDGHKELERDIEGHESSVKGAIAQARTLLDKTKSDQTSDDNQQYQKLKQNITDLGVRFEAAEKEVQNRSATLEMMHNDLEVFYEQAQKLEDWIDDAQDQTRALQRSQHGINNQCEAFKSLHEDIKEKESDLTDMVKAVNQFQEGSVEFQKASNNYRKQLHMSPTKPPRSSGTSALEDELENVEAKYREIARECARYVDTLGTIASEKNEFNELGNKLDNFYPKVENSLRQASTGGAVSNPKKAALELENLKASQAGLMSQSKTLKDMGEVAEKLADALSDMNKINEAAEVKKQYKDHQNKHKTLEEAINSKQEELSNVLSQSQDVSNRLEDVFARIDDAEKKLRHPKQISLDMEKLNEQIQEQKMLNADITAHKSVIERLMREAKEVSGAPGKLGNAKSKMDKLENEAAQRTRDLEEVATNLTELQSSAGKLDGWLVDSVGTLQDKMRNADRLAVKSKVDELYHQKRDREESMQTMKDMCAGLVGDSRVCDTSAPKEVVADVQTKWHELTELLVQQVSLEALTEIDGMLKYLDKAENEINTAEPISVEPDTLTVQLRDHNAFNEDLHEKRNAVKEIINKCNKMLRETTNEQTDEIKNRLDSIRTQADIVCQLSEDRLHQLEAALPLASHFSENHGELSAWLTEMEAELKAQGGAGDDLDQIKKQQEGLKGTQQIIEDHKPFVEDLNATGLEMMEICGDEDSAEVQGLLYGINLRYDELKTTARLKADELSEARKTKTMEVSDTIDSLLDDLCQFNCQILAADPIPSNPEKLKDEIEENKVIMDQAMKRYPFIDKTADALVALKNQDVEDIADIEDMESKLEEVKELSTAIQKDGAARDQALNEAMKVSDRFYDVLTDVTTGLRDLKDNILSQEPPGVDAPTVREQMKELHEFKNELQKCKDMTKDSEKIGQKLDSLCGETGKIEVKKQLEDLAVLLDDVDDITKDREEELVKGLQVAEKFQQTMDSIMSWLPISEHKLANMKSPASDPKILQNQTEEIQSFKTQIHPRVVDLEALNQQLASLRDTSPMAAESLQKPVQDVNARWNDLIRSIAGRETALSDIGLRVGELDGAMDDVINSVTQAEKDGVVIPETYADPKCLETRLKRLQLIQNDIKNQDNSGRKLGRAVDDLVKRTGDHDSSLQDKKTLMADVLKAAQVNTLGKQNQLQEALREVKKFVGSIEDLLQWVNELRMELKSPAPLGALPDTAKRQSDAFRKQFEDMLSKEDTVGELVAKGQTILDKCKPEEVTHMSEKLRKLKERWQDTKDRAYRRKDKLEEHAKNVSEFHKTLKGFTEWLTNSEITLRGFVYPSKLVDKVVKQMETHNNFKAEVMRQKEIMEKLDRTGTYLKYFGRKQDTIYIKNLLVGIRLRWKKLLRRVDERGRYLKQAHKEDKRFYDAWKSLCDWLDQSEKKMTRIISQAQSPNKVNQDIDEVKVFQQQLNSKHQDFYSATRLGRNLKDRCTKTDPEKGILQGMLDDLKNKWNFVRTVVSKSQNKLDEALLNSGRVSDALVSLLEWLQRTEEGLAEKQPVLGDVDTVHILIEQHRALQQELLARESTIESMKASGELPNSQIEELNTSWDRVNNLSDVRETKLQESLRLAEEFQEVVQVMREFLPQAEAELKIKGLPEDEMAIIQLIERHEKFQEHLRNHQDHVDKIKELAEDILRNCHPNAVRFVKYYLTITQTRWDQILARAKSRAERLQDALRSIQGNAALLEELLAWLTDAQVLLATKERDPVPDDLRVVEELVAEHLEFHEDITSKNADVDRLTKVVSSEFAKYSQGRNYGSNWKLNEIDTQNPRVIALQNKWRTVWRMSVDRKKRLQDSLEQLLEMESFKSFDFELWRQRYINWIAAKKLRITDFFRRQDKDCDGALNREEFVFGMLQAKFPTNRTELNAVFDIFDRNNTGYIEYKEFIDALRPEKHRRGQRGKKPKTDSELIHDDIERNVSQCQCRRQFKAEKVDEGKYKFGENQIKLVRFLNTTVMVRVGGGWVTLAGFLEQNDPCRAKGRTNVDLRDQLSLPDGTGTQRQVFSPRRSGIPPRSTTPTSNRSTRKHTTDTGYASSNSSAGSSGNLSTSRKNKTMSMINLTEVTSTPTRRNPEFGSTSDLNRTRRLSDSSSSLASGMGRSTKSTRSQASTSSRPKTPNYESPRSAASPSPRTSTPNRPTTPSSGGRSTTTSRPKSRSRPTTPVQHHYGWR